VYRTRDTVLKRDVAIKTIAAEDLSDNVIARFTQEALAISQIDHPNVVRLLDYGVHDRLPYMVMEYLTGQDLGRLLKGPPLAQDRFVDIMLGVCAGVFAAHRRDIVHRDLKPQNIFIAQTDLGDTVKVLDFGVSKLPRTSMTGGHVVGTPRYMSPEQATRATVDAKSDQYSIGVLLYLGLTGHVPHEEIDGRALLKAIPYGGYVEPQRHKPELQSALCAATVRAMATAADQRYPDVHALGRTLLPFATKTGQDKWTDHFTSPPQRINLQQSGPNPSPMLDLPTAPSMVSAITVVEDGASHVGPVPMGPLVDQHAAPNRLPRGVPSRPSLVDNKSVLPRARSRVLVGLTIAVIGIAAGLVTVLMTKESAQTLRAGPSTASAPSDAAGR
jgi:serine/threonine-protein kinase